MIAAQLINMLQVQKRLNETVNPSWLTANYDWSRAIMVESVELLDHVGWKWWKSQKMDLPQAHLEFVDIWHFVLSAALVKSGGVIQAAALSILERWAFPLKDVLYQDENGSNKPVDTMNLQRRIELFASLAGINGSIVLPLLRSIADGLEIDDAMIFELYMCKNALNQFRQAHGYKEGTYTKVWNGREDNDVLQEIVDTIPNITFEGLLNALEVKYAALIK